jgi:hypothetical protein
MPVKPDSRFAAQPVLRVEAPDGSPRDVITMRLLRREAGVRTTRHVVVQGEQVDLLARLYFGSERLWWRILDANPVLYPLDLRPGDVLEVPEPGPATRVTRARRF